jgi:hypothetical protein
VVGNTWDGNDAKRQAMRVGRVMFEMFLAVTAALFLATECEAPATCVSWLLGPTIEVSGAAMTNLALAMLNMNDLGVAALLGLFVGFLTLGANLIAQRLAPNLALANPGEYRTFVLFIFMMMLAAIVLIAKTVGV